MYTMTEISVSTQRRLLKDVRDILKHPLTDEGITYIHDEDNMMKGYAMILGPQDSPYEHGFFLFEFTFPVDYPFNPPIVLYKTNDGVTRFHPNLYSNGKVCLSILNTWDGEQWTSSQTIRSILMTIRSLFDWKALTMEPGFKPSHPEVNNYDNIVQIKTIQLGIFGIMKDYLPQPVSVWGSFLPIMRNYLRENQEKIGTYISDVEKKTIKRYKARDGIIRDRVYRRNISYSFSYIQKEWEAFIKV